MRRLLLAMIVCCATQPCVANLLDPLPAQWMWPPREAGAGDSSNPASSLPQVLVQAARYRAGPTGGIFNAEPAGIIFSHDAPIPRPRIVPDVPDVPNVPIEEVCETLASAAQSHNLPVPFFIRLIWQESRFDPRAISPVGAQGVAQFMPATAAAVGLKNPFDPLAALRSSAGLLRELVAQFGNLGLAAAAYNAGPKRILDWLARRGKLPEETRNYVQTITGHPAERWRVTRPGQWAIDAPKRAPCRTAGGLAYLVEMPAPAPVSKRKAHTRLLAKGKGGPLKLAAAAAKKKSADISGVRKRGPVRIAAQQKVSSGRTAAARSRAPQRHVRRLASR